MLQRAIQTCTVILSLCAAAALLTMLFAVLNPAAWARIGSEVHQGVRDFFGGLGFVLQQIGIGIEIVFIVGFVLGAIWATLKFILPAAIDLKHQARARAIHPGKYGAAQTMQYVLPDGSVGFHDLANTSMPIDANQMIAALRQAMQANYQGVNTIVRQQKELDRLISEIEYVDEDAPKQIEGPTDEAIPAVVKYSDVVDEVPEDMSLLGIHPSNGDLELIDWEKLKMVWLVGTSSTGKSNTIFGKALEAYNKGAKFIVIDPHIVKPDSLGRRLAPLSDAFLCPIASTEKDTLAAFARYKAEFERRVRCPICARGNQCAACAQKIVLICDETNRIARNEELKKPLQEIVAICGEESRGFGMYGWFLSQKAAHMKWLRDSAITVIVHKLMQFQEALLACNEDREAARRLQNFPVGRTYIYGVDFDPVELQQPLYEPPNTVNGSISYPISASISEPSPSRMSEDTYGDIGEKPVEIENTEGLTQAQKIKLLQVLEMDAQQKSQNEIIKAVWNAEPKDRAGQKAAEELRKIRAYIASEQRKRLGV